MRTVFNVLGWSIMGAFLAGTLAFAGFLLFNFHEILGPKDADEIQAWARFGAIMESLGFALVGFVLGGSYGIVRSRRRD